VKHKRTFFFLEQLLLKHRIVASCIGLKEQPDGLDFFWAAKAPAVRQVQFLQSVVPTRLKQSKRLISQDDHKNTKNYKHSLFIEIAPICKDDLVCLHPKLCQELGGVSPLMLCYKVTNALHFIDPLSLKVVDVSAAKYWQYPFPAILSGAQLTEYTLLDIEKAREKKSAAPQNKAGKFPDKYALAEVECARSIDLGENDKTYRALTHLGNVLKAGDTALGYDMQQANFTDAAQKTLGKLKKHLPDVILVRKNYKRNKSERNWKLKQLVKEAPDKPLKKSELEQTQADYEQFMRDLEEDPELRSRITIYKDKKAMASKVVKKDKMDEGDEEKSEDGEGEDVPEIPIER
jgi:nonsense-mediated mRNA decay protein 3